MDPALLKSAYWKDAKPDVRLNPAQKWDRRGIADGLARLGSKAEGHVVFATSGSEAGPKLVLLSKLALLDSAEQVNQHLGCEASDRWWNVLPTYHVGGFGAVARARCAGGWVGGEKGKWNAERFVEALKRERITVTSLVPAQVYDLVEGGWTAPEGLRHVLVGGGALDEKVWYSAMSRGWPLRRSYGMTETASQIATEEGMDSVLVGEPVFPVMMEWEVREGASGCLEVQGSTLFTGYLECSAGGLWEFRERCETADGWWVTGDVGEVPRPGRVRVVGRANRTVKVLGELVNLDRLERGLPERLRVDSIVAAVPDARRGSRLVFVTGEEVGPEVREALAGFNAGVPPYERIMGFCRVEAIPRSELGKIRHREVQLDPESIEAISE